MLGLDHKVMSHKVKNVVKKALSKGNGQRETWRFFFVPTYKSLGAFLNEL
jgi:hypothetical protein